MRTVASLLARLRDLQGLGRELATDETGQDLVEYTLLLMFFGVVMLAVWTSIASAIGVNFSQTGADVQDLWEPPAPGGGTP